MSAPFDETARIYLGAGWWPIPVHGKAVPAKGTTGYGGTVTPEKVEAWLQDDLTARAVAKRGVGLDNIGLRHQLTLAIDVDQGYGVKSGVASLAAWAGKLGLPPLPATWSSTARGDDSPSRQYLYRIPEDAPLKTKPCDSVELCCWHHRFTVVSPTIHPGTKTAYRWYLPGADGVPPSWGKTLDVIPSAAHLPHLPPEWWAAFRGGVANADRTAATVDLPELMATFPDGDPDGLVRWLIEKWSDPAQHVGHDEAKDALIHAFLLGREGHPGVRELYRVLVERFTTYLAVDRPDVAAVEVRSLVEACATIAQQKPINSHDWAGLIDQPRTIRTQRTVPRANRSSLAGIARTVLTAHPDDRERLFRWAVKVLSGYVAANQLDGEAASRLATGIADQAEIDPAVARSLTTFGRRRATHA